MLGNNFGCLRPTTLHRGLGVVLPRRNGIYQLCCGYATRWGSGLSWVPMMVCDERNTATVSPAGIQRNASKSARTPVAVTAGPAPGPVMTSGASW